MYIDVHLHPADYFELCDQYCGTAPHKAFAQPVSLCCSAHTRQEFRQHQQLMQQGVFTAKALHMPEKQHVFFSFGIHPQNPVTEEADFLYGLLQKKEIQAVGECGFDLFNDGYKRTLAAQHEVWNMQLHFAELFQVPIIIHCRKALPLIFASVPALKRLPAVIFHGWGGSPHEASSLLKKGVNAYFSIGKAVLRGQKSVCAMAAAFDISRLLTETDAPYMRLKHDIFSHPYDITAVTAQCALLRHSNGFFGDETGGTLSWFLKRIEENFNCIFGC